jgi:hypothetical protein
MTLTLEEAKAARADARRELAERVAAMKGEGINPRDIAPRLGISTSYAYELLSDPTGEKAQARKARLRGKCEKCGSPTSLAKDGRPAPRECQRCISNTLFGLPINREVERAFCGFKGCMSAPEDGLMCGEHGELLARIRAEFEADEKRARRRRFGSFTTQPADLAAAA